MIYVGLRMTLKFNLLRSNAMTYQILGVGNNAKTVKGDGSEYVTAIRYLKPWRDTYQQKDDVFPRWYLVVPAIILAFIPGLHDRFTVLEVSWSFSIYLEALAVIPQLKMSRKCGEIEMYMLVYLLLLATYRTL